MYKPEVLSVYSVHLRQLPSLFQGIITSAIAYPRYKPDINTLADLLESNLTFAVHNRHIRIYNRSLGSDTFKAISRRTEVFNDIKIKQAIVQRQFQYAILLRKSDAHYISRKPSNTMNGRPLYHTVQECPVPCSIVYALRYGSPYLPKLNNILHHLNQGGILQQWTKSDDYRLRQTTAKALYANDKERKPLSTETVKEVFVVLIIGVLISILVFAIELSFHHVANFFIRLRQL